MVVGSKIQIGTSLSGLIKHKQYFASTCTLP